VQIVLALTDKERWDIIDRLAEIPKLTNDLSVKSGKIDPKSKSANRVTDERDTMQLFKKQGGKTIENEKFMKVYGTEQMKQYDPEKATFYDKKGYKDTRKDKV